MASITNTELLLGLYEEEDEGEAGALVALPDGRVTCLKCGKTLSNVHNGKRHFQTTHQPNQPARCKVCKKLCKNKQSRDAHLRITHGLTPKQMKNIIPAPLAPTSTEAYTLDDQM